MKRILIIFLMLMVSVALKAQTTLQDVVYLHNGSVIRGTLIEQVPNVKIRTSDGSVWVFKQEEVDKITSEPSLQQTQQQRYYDDTSNLSALYDATANSGSRRPGYIDLSHGFRFFVDFSYLQQTNSYTCSAVSYSVSFGWQVLPYLYAGFGLAAQAYMDYWYYGLKDTDPELYAQMPMFTDIRYDVKAGKYSPFVGMRVGYAVSADEVNDYQGFYLNPSIGFRFKRLSFSLGGDFVKLKDPWEFIEFQRYGTGPIEYHETLWQSTVMFKVAYEWGGRM